MIASSFERSLDIYISKMSLLQENCISSEHDKVLREEKPTSDRKVLKVGETLPGACQESVVGSVIAFTL
jgi:hypothetical protein